LTTANSILFRLLLAIVLWAPLPLGSNRPWSWSLLALGVGALTVAWAVLAVLGRARAPLSGRVLWLVAFPFIAILAWAFLQTSSLLSPNLWHPMWVEAGHALGATEPSGMVTADPALTRTAILRLACYGAIFWLAVQLGRERSRAHEAGLAFCIASVAYAAYGLTMHFAGWEVILWLPKWAYIGDLTSTFVNRNAYGAYAGLGTVYCIGLFIHVLRPSHSGRDRRVAELAETVISRALPYLLGALVTGSALLLSHSRGAFLATGVAIVLLLLQLALVGVMRTRMAIILVSAVLTLGVVTIGVSGEATLSRLTAETSPEHEADRVNVYRLSVEAIKDAAATGTGLGAFLPAFRIYRDTSLPSPTIWDYAHNIYLEVAMDIGLPMGMLFAFGLLLILGVCLRGLMVRRRDHIYPALAIAVAALLGIHGAVDFSPQTPAVAATLALLLGIGFAQSWNTVVKDSPERPQPS
jgi:O-antigen ligase